MTRRSLFLVVSLWPLFATSFASARHAQETGFLNRKVTIGDSTYKYQVYVPEDWSTAQKWPVILFLHGAGERGSDGLDETQIGLPAAIRAHPERWPFLVVLPQVPYGHHHWTDPDMVTVAMSALEATVKDLKGDRQRLYLTGMSLGGYGVWELARRYPQHFAAIVPVCGGIYWPYAPERGWFLSVADPDHPAEHDGHPHEPGLPEEFARAIGKTPVWMFHGADDPVVSPRQSEIMYDAIRANHGHVRLWEYASGQHNAWDRAYVEPELPRWLLAHKLSDVSPVFAEKILVPIHPVPAKVSPSVYDTYAGTYVDSGIVQATIFRQGDGLFERNRFGEVSELLPENATTFFYPHGGPSRIIFQKTPAGQVRGILFHDDRHEEEWERREPPPHR